MPFPTPTPSWTYRLCRGLVAACAAIVPRRRRQGWRREWEAELWHRFHRPAPGVPADQHAAPRPTAHPRADLLRHTSGALRHAVWVRRRERRTHMLQDLRHAFRNLRRTPAFTAIAIGTLTLGIAVNTAVFSLVNAMLLRPWPYEDVERIVRLYTTDVERGGRAHLSLPDLFDLADAGVFSAVAGTDREPYSLRSGDRTVHVQGARTTAGLFDVLGVRPVLGRTFAPGDDLPGAPDVVVLGERLWRSAFAADPGVLGSTVWVDAMPRTVIGVVPRGAAYPDEAHLWVPMKLAPSSQERNSRWVNSIARLEDGVDEARLQGALELVAGRLAEEHPGSNEGAGFLAVPLREARTEGLAELLLPMLGAVVFVLLIACANVAGLSLARGAERRHELAVRAALGAGHGRLVSQLVLESLLLAGAAGVAGLVVGLWIRDVIMASIPVDVPDWVVVELDGRVLAGTAAAALLATLVAGIVPAVSLVRGDLAGSLETGTRSTAGRGGQRGRAALVVAEVALSVVLLAGAGLMIQSFLRLADRGSGLQVDGAFMMTTDLVRESYPEAAQRVGFTRRVADRLRETPGVEAVGGITQAPLSGGWSLQPFTVEGQSAAEQEDNPMTLMHVVTPGYVEAVGLPVLAGRSFEAGDAERDDRVLVNRTLARRFWPGEPAVGRRLKFGSPDGDTFGWMEVVGVVGDSRHVAIEDEPRLEVYHPYAPLAGYYGRMTWVVRTGVPPQALMEQARRTVTDLDPDQAVYDLVTLQEAESAALWSPLLAARVFWAFGVLALLLTAVGLYGLVGTTVARRRGEIGVRMALGARGGDVVGMMLRQGMTLVLVGALLGLAGAVALGRLVSGLLYQVDPADPLALAAATALLAGVALVATWVPARRATRIDPVTALRPE